jgi:hypothetical protein
MSANKDRMREFSLAHTLCVVCVPSPEYKHDMHSHAERGNEKWEREKKCALIGGREDAEILAPFEMTTKLRPST